VDTADNRVAAKERCVSSAALTDCRRSRPTSDDGLMSQSRTTRVHAITCQGKSSERRRPDEKTQDLRYMSDRCRSPLRFFPVWGSTVPWSLSGLHPQNGNRGRHAKARTFVHQHGRAGFRRCPRQSPLRMPRRRNPPGVPSPCCSNLRLGPTAYSCRSRG